MSSHGDQAADTYLSVQRALEIVRNSEGAVDQTSVRFLERSIDELWGRIQTEPNTYLMTKDDFALFNYFRTRFTTSNTAQNAIQRFWDNYQGDPRDFERD